MANSYSLVMQTRIRRGTTPPTPPRDGKWDKEGRESAAGVGGLERERFDEPGTRFWPA